MKTATIIVKLTKDHHVRKSGVTPIETMILAAEHNINSKGDPIEVVAVDKTEVTRTEDEEISRLKRLYAPGKIAMLKEVRQLPTDFADAVTKGKEITMPGGLSSQPKASVIASTPLKV